MTIKIRIFREKNLFSVIVMLIAVFAVRVSPCSAQTLDGRSDEVIIQKTDTKTELNDNSRREVMIVSGHPNYPPVMWKQGNTITGAGVELVTAVCDELDIPFEIRWSGPWKRVQKNAMAGDIDLIVGIYSNNERREYLDYTLPYMIDPTVIAVLKDNKFACNSREDLIGKIGISIHGDSFGQGLDDYIKTKLNVERTYSVDALFKNLIAGRVEYILWGYYPVTVNAARLGFHDKILINTPPLATENMYMAFSKKSGFGKYLKQTNSIIKRLKKNGTIQKWVEQYLLIYNSEQNFDLGN